MELAEVGGGAAAAVLSTALAIAVVALAAPAATVAAAGVALAAVGPTNAGASVPGGKLPLFGAESKMGMVSLTVWGCEAFRGGDALAVVLVLVGTEPVGAAAAVVAVGAEA